MILKQATAGNKVIYHFLTDCEYEYTRKAKAVSAKTIARDKAFEDAILEIISEQPLNTAANMTRIIKDDWPEVTCFGYTDKTLYEYVRQRTRKWFGRAIGDNGSFDDVEDMNMRKGYIARKVWCKLDAGYNIYKEMPQEQVDDFISMVKKHIREAENDDINLMADKDAGTISDEEYSKMSSSLRYDRYVAAKQEFKEKYGYYPIKVPEYRLY